LLRAVYVLDAARCSSVGMERIGMDRDMTAEELLKLCHAYLRGAEINTPEACKPVDRDTLARLINQHLNGLHSICSAQNAEPIPASLKQEQPETV
jgi:hypothetical protein